MAVVMTYKLASKSAKALASSLNAKRVRHNGKFRNNYSHRIINWGCSSEPTFPLPNGILNKPSAVRIAANKYYTIRRLTERSVPTLTYWMSPTEAAQSLIETGIPVFARKTLTGRSGRGIVVIKDVDDMVAAPLYTQFFDKVTEYRVHATADGGVFDYQAKLTRSGEEADPYVFSYDNGRVFCRGGIELPEAVANASVDAIKALELDFGAVDIGIDAEGNVAVFEVNTACALEGTTLDRYTEILGSYL